MSAIGHICLEHAYHVCDGQGVMERRWIAGGNLELHQIVTKTRSLLGS